MKFKYSIENFRAIAILFVMFSHLTSYRYAGDVGNAIFFLFGGGTIWFIFISGYLFSHIEFGKYDFVSYMKKKIPYVVVPYLVFSALAIAAGISYAHPQLLGLSNWAYAGWSLLVGGAVIYPLWFIPMMILFYLASPLIYRLRHSKALYVITLVAIVYSLYFPRPVLNLNPFLSFPYFLGYYLLGVLASLNHQAIEKMSTGWSLAWIGLGLAVFLASGFFYTGFDPGASFFRDAGKLGHMQLGKLGLLIAVFLGFEKFFNRRNAVLSYIAGISFGLFFVHGLFMGSFSNMSMHLDFHNDVSMIFSEGLVVIPSAFITVFLLKKLLGKRSRYAIGC